LTNDPSWDEIFSSQPSTDPSAAPTGTPAPATGQPASVPPAPVPPIPRTRRELREAEGRERARQPHPEEPREEAVAAVPVADVPRAEVPAEARAPFAAEVPRAEPLDRTPPAGGGGRPPRGGREYPAIPKRKRRLGWLWVLLALIAIGGGVAAFAWINFEPQVRQILGIELPIDYEGTGNGTPVDIVIKDGDIGEDIATTLYEAGVTMTFDAFYEVLLAEEPTFMPGTYTLQEQMSAASALDALQDPANYSVSKAVVIEGTTLPTALARLAEGTAVPLADLQAASKDLASFGLPAEAPSLEGYLFPATYEFQAGLSAHDVLQTLVTETFTRLDAKGVAVADRHRVLTLAGLVQKEGGPEKDFPRVARVFQNRIDIGMDLQSDATVSYGIGGPDNYGATGNSIFTSDEERADASNPYNTYANSGLPVGPISAPGDAAVAAVLNPEPGPWLFFVLVNGETGETTFSTTVAEHDAAVKVWQKWVADNPDWNTGG